MTDPQRGANPVHVDAARSRDGDITLNTLNLRWEHREILYYQGVQYTNEELRYRAQEFPDAQNIVIPGAFAATEQVRRVGLPWTAMRQLPLVPNATRDVWEYRSDEQRVMYTLRIFDRREQFRDALETPGALVFYAGHARYGQGPTFGPKHRLKGEHWGGDSDDLSMGALRMGFRYLARDVEDIFHHGYTPQLVPASVTLDPQDCNPENLAPLIHRFRPMTLREIDPELPALFPGVYDNEKFWARRKPAPDSSIKSRRRHTFVVIRADWQHTRGEPQRMDLGSIHPRCRAFVCIACSSYWHFFTPWRQLKQWRYLDDDRLMYGLTATAFLTTANFYLYHLLTYPERSGWRAWRPWMDWAMHRTNRWLGAYVGGSHARITNGLSGSFARPDGECHCGPRR